MLKLYFIFCNSNMLPYGIVRRSGVVVGLFVVVVVVVDNDDNDDNDV